MSDWELTETYSPAANDIAPATRPAIATRPSLAHRTAAQPAYAGDEVAFRMAFEAAHKRYRRSAPAGRHKPNSPVAEHNMME